MQSVIDGRQRFREERLKSSNAELRGSRFQDHLLLWGGMEGISKLLLSVSMVTSLPPIIR